MLSRCSDLKLAPRLQPPAARGLTIADRHLRRHVTGCQRRQPRMLGSVCMVLQMPKPMPTANSVRIKSNTCGPQVGLLDVDICGPSVPRMLGLEGHDIHSSASVGTSGPLRAPCQPNTSGVAQRSLLLLSALECLVLLACAQHPVHW
jgi:Mrp family chromosome partitioning ATPase